MRIPGSIAVFMRLPAFYSLFYAVLPCDSSAALIAGFALIQALYLRIGGGLDALFYLR